MKTDQEISDTIMRRVRVIHARRALLSPRTRFIALLVVTFALSVSVSVKDVLLNAITAADSFAGFVAFALHAIRGTEFFVQVALLGVAILGAFAVRDVCLYCISHQIFALFTGRQHAHENHR